MLRVGSMQAIVRWHICGALLLPSLLLTAPARAEVQPTISITDVSMAEGNPATPTFVVTNFVFTVSLSSPSAQTITVEFATQAGTATPGSDYTSQSGVLTFDPNVTSRTITIAVVGDNVFEPDETFFVNLTNASNASIGDTKASARSATTTIFQAFGSTTSPSRKETPVLPILFSTSPCRTRLYSQ